MDHEHLGWQMIRRIHTTLRIDEAWTDWHDDGFTWWAHKVAQRFRFEGPVDVSGIATWWASFETDFLQLPGNGRDGTEVRAEERPDERAKDLAREHAEDLAREHAEDLNRKHGLFTAALVGTRLVLRNRTYALEETMAHRCWQLGERALFANILANRVVNAIDAGKSDLGPGLEPDVSGHPRNRVRSLPDEMLNVIDDVYRAKDMMLPTPSVAEAAATLEMGGFVRVGERDLGNVQDDAVALERYDETRSGSIVVVIDPDAEDELVGPGMRVRSVLPGGVGSAEATRAMALRLNEAAWTTHEPLVGTGAWSAGPEGLAGSGSSLVHTSFYPRVSLAKQYVVGAVMEEMAHGVWGAGVVKDAGDE